MRYFLAASVTRSTLFNEGLPSTTVHTLVGVYDSVWSDLEPKVSSRRASAVQEAIADALIAMAKGSQLDLMSTLHVRLLQRVTCSGCLSDPCVGSD